MTVTESKDNDDDSDDCIINNLTVVVDLQFHAWPHDANFLFRVILREMLQRFNDKVTSTYNTKVDGVSNGDKQYD